MTHITRFAAPALAAFAMLTVAVPASAPAVAKGTFDGAWSVLIVTEKGTCDRAYRYPGQDRQRHRRLRGRCVLYRLRPRPADRRRDRHGRARHPERQRLGPACRPTGGTGSWVAGSGECSGTWTAERRSS